VTSKKRSDTDKARATGKRRAANEERSSEQRPITRKHARPDRGGPLVLVVDDFKDGRDLAVETLEHAGMRTIEAGDGQEALTKARQQRPDVILMDLSLPGMDGWEVTRRLKGDAVTRDIRIIALTAHAQSDALDRARKAGADGVITKPCLPTFVVEQVREMLANGTTSADQRDREEA
jgi:two-component system cell cycle response regulator DivK